MPVEDFIMLSSVGTWINTVNLTLHPNTTDGHPDEENWVHIWDATDEWRTSLSYEDRKKIHNICNWAR